MNRMMIALAFAGLATAAPLGAQEVEPPVGGEAEKTQQERLAELHKLMKKASEDMAELERELAKASLASPKADVVKERMEKLREAMRTGKLEELPEGLKEAIRDNPEEVARATGKSEEEVRKLAEDSEKLSELLRQNPDLLKKLAESEDTMQKVLEKQHAVEKKLAETLQKQEDAAEGALKKVDESVELAHQLRQQGQGQGQGQPDKNKQSTQDPKNKGEKQGDPNKPNKGAEEGYQPGPGEKPEDHSTDDYDRGEKGGFQADKKTKDVGDGSSNQDSGAAPAKYKGFREKFERETRKKGEERKSTENKDK